MVSEPQKAVIMTLRREEKQVVVFVFIVFNTYVFLLFNNLICFCCLMCYVFVFNELFQRSFLFVVLLGSFKGFERNVHIFKGFIGFMMNLL